MFFVTLYREYFQRNTNKIEILLIYIEREYIDICNSVETNKKSHIKRLSETKSTVIINKICFQIYVESIEQD